MKLDVDNEENDWLYQANMYLQVLPGINTFPEYVPHVTLAYVRAGWFADHADERYDGVGYIYTNDVTYSPAGSDDVS